MTAFYWQIRRDGGESCGVAVFAAFFPCMKRGKA